YSNVHFTPIYYNNRTWDGWLCWDDTPAGTFASQNCPDYLFDFDPTGEQCASKMLP
uniref:G-protein coupled receptors family 2 profile 1 domain-containing protein n=1 Tax=Sander lucioperca TaxID=283035 RepID=A0A8D0D715_SANLU